MQTIRLYNGVEMPVIGYGPGGMGYVSANWPRWLIRSIPFRAYMRLIGIPVRRRAYVDMIANGFKRGFRLLDYSAAYGNGAAICKAIIKSKVKREGLFLTGRISNSAQFCGPDAVRDQIHAIINGYGVKKLDLLMFHWPVTGYYEDTWKVMCDAYDKGLARSIGVANCNRHHLEKIMNIGLKPMVNQFEVHPLFTQKDLIKYNQDSGIVVEAYTPIARNDNRLMGRPVLRRIASAHGKTPVQVVLRWHVQNGCVPIVRSMNRERQKENLDIFDFNLSQEEMSIIDGLNINSRLRFDPDNCDFTVL